MEVRRETGVAIVERHDSITALNQMLRKLGGPPGKLHGSAGDEEDRLATFWPEAFVSDGDPVGFDESAPRGGVKRGQREHRCEERSHLTSRFGFACKPRPSSTQPTSNGM